MSLQACEAAIDSVIEASPPALMTGVRSRLARPGTEDGEEERVLVARLLESFVEDAPRLGGARGRPPAAGVRAALRTGLAAPEPGVRLVASDG